MHIKVDEFTVFARKGEFRIVFAFFVPGDEEGKFEELVTVSISPEGAKRLAQELESCMKRYEKKYGKVKPWEEIPPAEEPLVGRYIA